MEITPVIFRSERVDYERVGPVKVPKSFIKVSSTRIKFSQFHLFFFAK